MQKIIAIAGLTIRDAARSRVLHALTISLLLVVIAVPLLIQGDGTVPGRILVVLRYTLGAVVLLMGTVTLWLSCAAISRDIEGRHLRLTLVKPVHRHELWLGRWCGMVALIASLLLLCAATTGILLSWTLHRTPLTTGDRQHLFEQVFIARRQVRPQQVSIHTESIRRYNQLRAQGSIPPAVPESEALQRIHKQVLTERTVLPPGREISWTFAVPESIPSAPRTWLRFKLASAYRTTTPIEGTWTIGTEADPHALILKNQRYFDGQHLLPIPADMIHPGTPIRVRFQNGSEDVSHTVIFAPGSTAEILIHEGGFVMNLLRVHLVLLCQLALLAAVGLTMGALFSFPVATFVATALVMVVLTSRFFVFAAAPERSVEHHHLSPSAPDSPLLSVPTRIAEHFTTGVQEATASSVQTDVLDSLADGILVSWKRVGQTALLLVVLYSGCLGIAGSFILSRREIARLQ